jgi:uncharacterized protein (DUF433 family)
MAKKTIDVRSGPDGKSAYITGTRVRVLDIAELHDLLSKESIDERIQRALPHLTLEQIQAALAYWREHREEITAEIAKRDLILEKTPSV